MNGILPLYKPKGMTSHDCVAKIRKLTRQRKIGHTGTLDPDAVGVLPICLGKATKIVQYMSADTKMYEAEITLGTSTTTEDRSGEVVAEQNIGRPLAREEIVAALRKWTGPIEQTPPMYSAVKVRGKRLYEYAREGIEVERPKRAVTIFELTLLDDRRQFSGERISFSVRVRCSKGTYIRTLASDIGATLGYPAHMSQLTRTASGPFTVDDCLTLSEVERSAGDNTLSSKLFPLDKGLSSFKRLVVDEKTAKKIVNGNVLPFPQGMKDGRFTVYNEEGTLLAIYRRHPAKPGWMKPEKVLYTALKQGFD
ncbi:MAG TPA: tRNA pseudouridine(55) synthase TruB [Bacillales bacterium]|nr:tRNA pseudouridine(55) synthase TruB [Bacillales bacterium]